MWSPACTAEDRQLVEQLLEPLGSVEPIAAERLMDVVRPCPAPDLLTCSCSRKVWLTAAEQEGFGSRHSDAAAQRDGRGARVRSCWRKGEALGRCARKDFARWDD